MRARALLIVLGVALTLAACGRQEPSGLAPAKAPAPAATPAVSSTATAVPGKTAASTSQTRNARNNFGDMGVFPEEGIVVPRDYARFS